MLRRRSIRLRILVLVLVPVIALIGLFSIILGLTVGQLSSLRQATTVRERITNPTTTLQAQLATERWLALRFIARYRDASTQSAWVLQQHVTNHAMAKFNAAARAALPSANSAERRVILTFQADLNNLGTIRSSVGSLGLTRAVAAGEYSSIIADGDGVLSQAIAPYPSSVGPQATDLITLYSSLQDLGEESDLIKADLIANYFSGDDIALIGQLATQRQELWNQAVPSLDPQYRRYLTTMIPGQAAQNVHYYEIEITGSLARRVSLADWTTSERAYYAGLGAAIGKAGAQIQTAVQNQESATFLRLALSGGLGLLAILITIIVAIAVGRTLLRQLNELRQSALELASESLPSTIERLRSGEDVSADEAAAPLLTPSTDEIGQVRRAFNTAAQTAVAAAVEEIKIRRGVNDVFRNLARRNQSLLTRQLQLLDAMERRVHDPEELADLFKIDHLTTRMRRHAEGLLIVAGGSSGRVWRDPVPVVDVMRAAIAEVENYTRIRVVSRTTAALAGHAVADVIHLLAELVENATMFSPANTPVRIEGDVVAKGLALEIEDRGLGMAEERLAEINATLADPPLFDLSGSDQLGLFIAGQLAKRHDIKITLRTSPYGGVTAVVLVPPSLVIDDLRTATGAISVRELGGRPVAELTGPDAASDADVAALSEPDADRDLAQVETAPPAFARAAATTPNAVAAEPEPFAVWTPSGMSADVTRTAGAAASSHGFEPPVAAMAPPLSAPVRAGAELPTRTPGMAAPPWAAAPPSADADEAVIGFPIDRGDPDDLPVRVRQANLAPQLRDRPDGDGSDDGRDRAAAVEQASPEVSRNTMAAWQRGWERGREAAADIVDEAGAEEGD
jgi:signal transduction histidine kinase